MKRFWIIISLLIARSLFGSDLTWDGTTNNWDSAHWLPGLAIPSNGFTYEVSSGTAQCSTVTFPGAELKISSGGYLGLLNLSPTCTGLVTFAGGTVKWAATPTADRTMTATGGYTVATSTTTIFDVTNTFRMMFTGAFSGAGKIRKQSSGTCGISTASPGFTGSVDVVGGSWEIPSVSGGYNSNTVFNIHPNGEIYLRNATVIINAMNLYGGTIAPQAGVDKYLYGILNVLSNSFIGLTGTVATLRFAGTLTGTNSLYLNAATTIKPFTDYNGNNYNGTIIFAQSATCTVQYANMRCGGIASSNGYGYVSSASGTKYLTLTPPAGTVNDYSGILSEEGANILGLTINGAGVQKLSGLCSNSAITDISNGTLIVNCPYGDNTNSIRVYAGATLGGTGVVYAVVTNLASSILSPGDSGIGTLTMSNLFLNATCTNSFDLGATAASDKVVINGSLAWGGVISVNPVSGFGAGEYTLITYTDGITTNGTPSVLPVGGYNIDLYNDVAGKRIYLNVADLGGGRELVVPKYFNILWRTNELFN